MCPYLPPAALKVRSRPKEHACAHLAWLLWMRQSGLAKQGWLFTSKSVLSTSPRTLQQRDQLLAVCLCVCVHNDTRSPKCAFMLIGYVVLPWQHVGALWEWRRCLWRLGAALSLLLLISLSSTLVHSASSPPLSRCLHLNPHLFLVALDIYGLWIQRTRLPPFELNCNKMFLFFFFALCAWCRSCWYSTCFPSADSVFATLPRMCTPNTSPSFPCPRSGGMNDAHPPATLTYIQTCWLPSHWTGWLTCLPSVCCWRSLPLCRLCLKSSVSVTDSLAGYTKCGKAWLILFNLWQESCPNHLHVCVIKTDFDQVNH